MSQIPDAISVVIPTYNRAHLIKESIQSVLNQTLQPYEIIVVDDFSTDNTEEVVNSFNSPLIKYVKNQRKKGANGARNTGILMAQGEYIAFHDSDDLWFSEKLELQKRALENKAADMCFCTLKKEGGGILNRKKVPHKQLYSKDIYQLLRLHNWISTQTIFVSTRLAQAVMFDEDLMRFQDWDFVLRFSRDYKIYHLNSPLVVQRLNRTSISNSVNYMNAYAEIYKKHPDLLNNGIFNKIVMQKIILSEKFKINALLKLYWYKFVRLTMYICRK